MKSYLFYSIIFATIFSSCSILKTNSAKTLDIESTGVIQMPYVADLEINETKVSGTATSGSSQTVEIVKQNAIADAIKNANCDIIVEPSYFSEQSGGRTKVTVIGYPARYKNFRPITEHDLKFLNVESEENISKAQVANEKKKRGIKYVVIGVGVLTVMALLSLLGG